MTGVSPIVLSDVTSGANTFEDLTWRRPLNDLCGFTRTELRDLLRQVVHDGLIEYASEQRIEEISQLMHNFYNGSLFIDDFRNLQMDTLPKVYNPTLAFYFLKEFQEDKHYPKLLIDQNLVPDDSKLTYIAEYKHGKKLLGDALNEAKPIHVSTLRKRFGIKNLLNPNLQRERLAVLLCYLGALTSVGETPSKKIILDVPNLVMQQLYGERILEQITKYDEEKIEFGQIAVTTLFEEGKIQPICTFIERNLFIIYHTKDAADFKELTLKTLFITLLYQSQLYIIESEAHLEQRFGDLLMIVRPGMRTGELYDILIEFKQLSLAQLTQERDGKTERFDGQKIKGMRDEALKELDAVENAFVEAKKQLRHYRQATYRKYGDDLLLRSYAVVGVGFARIVWDEVSDEDNFQYPSSLHEKKG